MADISSLLRDTIHANIFHLIPLTSGSFDSEYSTSKGGIETDICLYRQNEHCSENKLHSIQIQCKLTVELHQSFRVRHEFFMKIQFCH